MGSDELEEMRARDSSDAAMLRERMAWIDLAEAQKMECPGVWQTIERIDSLPTTSRTRQALRRATLASRESDEMREKWTAWAYAAQVARIDSLCRTLRPQTHPT